MHAVCSEMKSIVNYLTLHINKIYFNLITIIKIVCENKTEIVLRAEELQVTELKIKKTLTNMENMAYYPLKKKKNQVRLTKSNQKAKPFKKD